MESWVEKEIDGCDFPDARLAKRFGKLVSDLSNNIGESIPLASQDWANTKAAYRFFSNERISESEILAGHFEATRNRAKANAGTILVLHDTTEFSYKKSDTEALGVLTAVSTGKDSAGRNRLHTLRGILMHSSLAVTLDGLPLGLAAIKFWTRKKFKGTNALKRRINPTRIPIEEKESLRWVENLRISTELLAQPQNCVHVGDRESDIYELFCEAIDTGSHFLVRTNAGRGRLTREGTCTIPKEMEGVKLKGEHRIQVRTSEGKMAEVVLGLKYQAMTIYPPAGKQKRYPPVNVTVIYAQEKGKPKGRDRIDWRLITDLSVDSEKDAIQKLQWYAMRWKIETFHKILKSGCKAEESKLRSSERLVNLISVFCILSWRVFWLTMANRSVPDAPPQVVLTGLEIELLDKLVKSKREKPTGKGGPKVVSTYLVKIARLGGYLARASDPAPGNKVIWKGLTRLTDIELGYLLGAGLVGN